MTTEVFVVGVVDVFGKVDVVGVVGVVGVVDMVVSNHLHRSRDGRWL